MREPDVILEELSTDERDRINQRFVNIGRDITTCPRIILLVGVPCSGKSTWTKEYLGRENVRPTTIVSSDDQIDAYAKANNLTYEQALKQLDFDVLEKNMAAMIRDAVKAGLDVIVDRTNLRKKSRRRWTSQVPQHYVRAAVVFEVPETVIFERLKRRERETNKRVPVGVVKGMLETYQVPTLEEFDIIERISYDH